MKKVALVTGASSGIGKSTAEELCKNGFTVYAAARRLDRMKDAEIPEILIGVEFVFLVNLIRKATKVNIVPKSVTTKNTMTNKAYGEFLQAEIASGNANIIVFDKTDT